MSSPILSNASLHYTLIRQIIDRGHAPTVAELAAHFQASESELVAALRHLHADHGVVLHPHAPEVWVIHPFSLAPTSFIVRSADGEWWGNCAWCSLGVAALLDRDVTITTALGADDRQVTVHIQNGRVVEDQYLVHFPVPMLNAWDNVIYTCSTMLLFDTDAHVDRWSARHRIPKGDVRPITQVWDFSREWYGNHLNPAWRKWTTDEARALFARHNLTHPIWQLPASKDRF